MNSLDLDMADARRGQCLSPRAAPAPWEGAGITFAGGAASDGKRLVERSGQTSLFLVIAGRNILIKKISKKIWRG